MTSSSVARRYARALLSLGVEDGQFEAYAEQLNRILTAFQVSDELRDLWLNPAHGRGPRLAAVDGLAGPLGLSDSVANLLRLLVERRRMNDLEMIVRVYQDMVDERAGRLRATVTSAVPLAAEITARIAHVLAQATQKQITIETHVDPKLIGGVVTQVGSTVLDGSVRTQLELMRTQLKNAPL